MTNAIDTQLIADAGGTALWPMIALSNIAQGSAVFAYYFMHRHDEREAQISLPATISAYLGVYRTSPLWGQCQIHLSICSWDDWFSPCRGCCPLLSM